MSEEDDINLIDLLPSIYRLKDAESGGQLEAFLKLITDQANILKEDIDGLLDDLFIETCNIWIIPYIGDLVGNRPIREVDQRNRVDVAKTIYYRRRKGTLAMLEELARDVTGYGAHAVAFFELLGWTQNMNHPRISDVSSSADRSRDPPSLCGLGSVNLRCPDTLERLYGPFDTVSHTVDVRPIGSKNGWYNLCRIGFFLWRLSSYPIKGVAACPSSSGQLRYHFSPLGNPSPLFTRFELETDSALVGTEIHVPAQIRPMALQLHIDDYYGPEKSLAIFKGPDTNEENLVPASDIVVCDLSLWQVPSPGKIAVDPVLGRIAVSPLATGNESDFSSGLSNPESSASEITVSFNYGFSADIGGGPYDRATSMASTSVGSKTVGIWKVIVNKNEGVPSIRDALNLWVDAGRPSGIIEIEDDSIYEGNLEIDPYNDRFLVLQAGNHHRPVIKGDIRITGDHLKATIAINGLLISGGLHVEGNLGTLKLIHCTLVPGGGLTEEGRHLNDEFLSIDVLNPAQMDLLLIDHCIIGRISVPGCVSMLEIDDSIVDSSGGVSISGPLNGNGGDCDTSCSFGPRTSMNRCTIFGETIVKIMKMASEVIFVGRVLVDQINEGCMRFSYLPQNSRCPHKYRCLPKEGSYQTESTSDDGESMDESRTESTVTSIVSGWMMVPIFTSNLYGQPGYAQLKDTCPSGIKTGSEDGSEMGAFSSMKHSHREANLRTRLLEYLPAGMDAGIIYVN